MQNLEILTNIASGAHGTVFEALDTDLDRKVAVKIWYKMGDQVRQGAIKEVRRLAAITHPLFVTVYRLDVAGAAPYAMMELITGPSLKDWLKSNAIQAVPLKLLLPYLSSNAENVRQRCAFWFLYSKGLNHIYSQNALHGDPHTGNLLVVKDKTEISKTFQNHHILRHGSYASLKILDLGTSFLWKDSSKREEWEVKLIFETAERLFPDFPPGEVMRIGLKLQPKALLEVLDRFVEYVLELASVPSMTKTDFDFLSHGLPQLLGWCPFFNYSKVSDQLHVLL